MPVTETVAVSRVQVTVGFDLELYNTQASLVRKSYGIKMYVGFGVTVASSAGLVLSCLPKENHFFSYQVLSHCMDAYESK